MKSAIIDTSSAILLYKARLFGRLIDTYMVVMAASVFLELSVDGYAGADLFQQWGAEKAFRVLDPDPGSGRRPNDSRNGLPPGTGERDTLQLYRRGAGDFVIVDDRAAAVACKTSDIPYINALLVPRVLYMARCCFHGTFRRGTEVLISIGRYSDTILRTAENLSDASMRLFLP